MKFLITVILASLYESLECNAPFDNYPKDLGESGAFMNNDTNANELNKNDCKSCLWLTGSEGSDVNTALNLRRKKYNQALIDRVPFYASSYEIAKVPHVYMDVKNRRFIDGDVCCPVGQECIANISWDGKDEFKLLGFSSYPSQSALNTSQFSNWVYSFYNSHFNIYHHIPGGTRRKFLFKDIRILSEGNSRLNVAFITTDSYDHYNPDGPENIEVKEIGGNGDLSYVATVLGYIDNL